MDEVTAYRRATFIEGAARADLIRSRRQWAQIREIERQPGFIAMIERLTKRDKGERMTATECRNL